MLDAPPVVPCAPERLLALIETRRVACSDTAYRVDEGRVIVGAPDGLPVVPRALVAVPKVPRDARVVRDEARALDRDQAAHLVAAGAENVTKDSKAQA